MISPLQQGQSGFSARKKYMGTFASPAPMVSPLASGNAGFQERKATLTPQAPNQSVVPGGTPVFSKTPGATSPAPAPAASPAREQFKQTLGQPDAQPYAVTPTPISITGDTTTPSGAVVNATSGATVSAPAVDPQASYRSAFNEYLSSLRPSEEETRASKNLSALDLQAMKDQEEALNRGETLGFATGEAARVNKNNAFRRMAAADTLGALTGQRTAMTEAQKARMEFEKTLLPKDAEAFTLGKDQVRYDAKGNKIAGGITTAESGGGTYVSGANPTVDAYIKGIQNGTYKPSDVPEALQGAVAQGLAETPKKQSQTSETALGLVNELLGMNTNAITGIPSISSLFPGSQAQLTKNTYDQLKGILSLENRQLLKGSGAISDYEFKVLEKASSKLGTNLSNADFKKVLTDLKKDLSTPEEGIAPDEEEYLRSRGYSEEDINSLKGQSFKSVGGDTKSAMNRPQRNNNPLNIKASSATSTYPGVKGTDPSPASDGGKFLVFESPEAGFAAAKRLIQAPSYSNLTVDSALKRWSNNGYGGEIAPNIKGKTIKSLTPSELDSLIKTMSKREGYIA